MEPADVMRLELLLREYDSAGRSSRCMQ